MVKQTKERLECLTPIVDTLREFDDLKYSLEGSCASKSEYFRSPPPLELTVAELKAQQEETEAMLREAEEQGKAMEKLEELAGQFRRDIEVRVAYSYVRMCTVERSSLMWTPLQCLQLN